MRRDRATLSAIERARAVALARVRDAYADDTAMSPYAESWRAAADAARHVWAHVERARAKPMRSVALMRCHRPRVLATPTGGVAVDVEAGAPAAELTTCKHRLCPDCARNRAREAAGKLWPVVDDLRAVDDPGRRLRLVTLTVPDPAGGELRDQARALWRAWARLRASTGTLFRDAVAVMEVTANAERDSWHPHLHVLVWCDWADKWELLAAWQRACGFPVLDPRELPEDERGQVLGGVDVREVGRDGREAREVFMYAAKGLSVELLQMPAHRLVDLLDGLQRLRCLRTYGAFRKVADDLPALPVDDDGRPLTVANGDKLAPMLCSRTGEEYEAAECVWTSRARYVRELWRTLDRLFVARRASRAASRRLDSARPPPRRLDTCPKTATMNQSFPLTTRAGGPRAASSPATTTEPPTMRT